MKAIKIENNWEFIIVWKDKTLYTLQDELESRRENKLLFQRNEHTVHDQHKRTEKQYEYDEQALSNKTCPLYYVKLQEDQIDIRPCKEKENKSTKFVFMSSIPVTTANYKSIVEAGRRRWKIENEGFNVQKNNGYAMHHKMNRTNLTAMKNYYLCLQIAHIFDQLLTLSLNSYVQCWDSIKNMWHYITAALQILASYQADSNVNQKYNYRY